LSLRIPPLRERREDIVLLAARFLERLSRSSGSIHTLSDDTMNALHAYDWPGNVRELENCIERCCAMNSGPTIHIADLPSSITGAGARFSERPTETSIMRIADLEKQAIVGAVEKLSGDKSMAAKLLGIGKTTLYRKLKEYSHPQV
jgi:two-component system response regulator HydG